MSKPNIISLDIGTKRVGIARSNKIAKIAEPLMTVENNKELSDKVAEIADQQDADLIVVGLPRNLDSKDTEQTKYSKKIAKKITDRTGIKIVFYDEALSSIQAEEILKSKRSPYSKSDIDAMSAAVILDNFMESSF